MKNRHLLTLAIGILAFVGCGDNEICDGKECLEGVEVLDAATCLCVTIVTDPCASVVCPAGELPDVNCDCQPIDNSNNVEVTTNIIEDVQWTNDKIYTLGGRITVVDGATLTIEGGTIVKGQAGTAANATALVIARGGKIFANGTESAPIIFTSAADNITSEMVAAGNFSSPNLDPSVNGLWGGLIVLGKAPISAQNDNDQDVSELQIEGIPTSDSNGLYGGNDPEDSSGTLSYVSIRHGGTNIGAGNEINGLTLGGVGSQTSISNIEVVANQDDGIEWFGGTVDVSNVLVWNCGDDGLDTDQAWNGSCTNWIVVTPQGGSALELDGPEGTLTQGPNQFANGIIYAGDNIDHLIDWDDNTNSGIKDLYFFGIDPDYNSDGSFEPIESFAGDGSGNNGNWEYTLPSGVDASKIFTGVPTDALNSVSLNSKSVGPDVSLFAWTWGGASGALTGIGL